MWPFVRKRHPNGGNGHRPRLAVGVENPHDAYRLVPCWRCSNATWIPNAVPDGMAAICPSCRGIVTAPKPPPAPPPLLPKSGIPAPSPARPGPALSARAWRARRKKARDLRRRLDEAKAIFDRLEERGVPAAQWRAELAERWAEWDRAEEQRTRWDLVDSLRAIYPESTEPQLEELAEKIGRRTL